MGSLPGLLTACSRYGRGHTGYGQAWVLNKLITAERWRSPKNHYSSSSRVRNRKPAANSKKYFDRRFPPNPLKEKWL
jgi:hypothetical protein